MHCRLHCRNSYICFHLLSCPAASAWLYSSIHLETDWERPSSDTFSVKILGIRGWQQWRHGENLATVADAWKGSHLRDCAVAIPRATFISVGEYDLVYGNVLLCEGNQKHYWLCTVAHFSLAYDNHLGLS